MLCLGTNNYARRRARTPEAQGVGSAGGVFETIRSECGGTMESSPTPPHPILMCGIAGAKLAENLRYSTSMIRREGYCKKKKKKKKKHSPSYKYSSREIFMRSSAEHENSFITSGPDLLFSIFCSVLCFQRVSFPLFSVICTSLTFSEKKKVFQSVACCICA